MLKHVANTEGAAWHESRRNTNLQEIKGEMIKILLGMADFQYHTEILLPPCFFQRQAFAPICFSLVARFAFGKPCNKKTPGTQDMKTQIWSDVTWWKWCNHVHTSHTFLIGFCRYPWFHWPTSGQLDPTVRSLPKLPDFITSLSQMTSHSLTPIHSLKWHP